MSKTSLQGAREWLTALPLSIHRFGLNKGAFHDGWIPSRLLSHCVCGNKFTVDDCFNCKCGEFLSISHKRAYFDVRIYNPFARTYVNSLAAIIKLDLFHRFRN